MRQQVSFLTQSRFYSPVFNSAIFDGPVRIYFSQYQEPLALKLYFTLQERMKDLGVVVRDTFRRTGINVFVMLYPAPDVFHMCFDNESVTDSIVVERLGQDFVVGIKGPATEEDVKLIEARVTEIAQNIVDVYPPEALRAAAEA